ncbi:hypothetical protein OSH11_03065 [Kaistia dalseonensis]|uniref:DUF2975 domain-containing protein n=1 Tax=Kaistia dalseonensis TaxID=410840 RepID=A0ABU0H438_9HYPH|nr:hypothetical protein [Kaistia dalseonensis]MCX5493678.1 hypothetical protein [Kaistia dalseonensis]MDQ0436241.1 hypothetical protein [Kaistia dalseonensis]
MKNQSSLVFSGAVGSEAALGLSPRARIAFSALSVVALGLAALLPALAIGYWLVGSQLLVHGAGMQIVAIATALLHLLPMSWGLLRLRVCLTQFAAGRPFTAKGIAGLRDFALGTALSALAKPLAGMLFTLALSWNGGPKQIAIDISSDVMILALFAGVVASLAWAMEKAAVLAEENSQFV